MKIIHCADIHLDSNLQTNLSPSQARIRNLEILDTFERMIDFAQTNEVKVIIIAGDMFDTEQVQLTTQQRVLNAILKHPTIDFIYLAGNHDEGNFIKQLNQVPTNLKIYHDTWQTFHYGNVQITGCVLDDKNRGQIFNQLQLNPNAFNIVVLHGDINAREIDLANLSHHHIDYLALGHLHTYAQGKIDERGTYCYSGCLEGRGFDECGSKGFVMLEINETNRRWQSQFVNFAQRQLCELRYDITGQNNWFEIEVAVLNAVKSIARQNLIKITLVGQYDLSLNKQIEMLSQKLSDFYFHKIKDESVLMVNQNDVANDVSLRGEFIRQVLASHLSADEKEKIILWGTKALIGERLR